MPVVRLMTTSVSLSRMRATASRKQSRSRLPPGRLDIADVDMDDGGAGPGAAIADSAICLGVTGTWGLLPVVSLARSARR